MKRRGSNSVSMSSCRATPTSHLSRHSPTLRQLHDQDLTSYAGTTSAIPHNHHASNAIRTSLPSSTSCCSALADLSGTTCTSGDPASLIARGTCSPVRQLHGRQRSFGSDAWGQMFAVRLLLKRHPLSKVASGDGSPPC